MCVKTFLFSYSGVDWAGPTCWITTTKRGGGQGPLMVYLESENYVGGGWENYLESKIPFILLPG